MRQKNICLFISGFPVCPNPKHFIVNCEQNVVKYAETWGKMYWKMQFLYKMFRQNNMLCRTTIPSFFKAVTWNTQIYIFFFLKKNVWPLCSFKLDPSSLNTFNTYVRRWAAWWSMSLRCFCLNLRNFSSVSLSLGLTVILFLLFHSST